MKKYTIRLEREEFYEIVVDVVAESEAEAVTEVERRHDGLGCMTKLVLGRRGYL